MMLTSSAIATLISWNQKLEIAIVFLYAYTCFRVRPKLMS